MQVSPQSALDRYQTKMFPGSSHSWACGVLTRELAQKPALKAGSVLDIGSGSGIMGAFLQQQGISGVDGIEIDADAIRETSKWYRNFYGTIDEVSPEPAYQIILMLDILEHLVTPETLLKAAVSRLAPGGIILVSVPNIAHWGMRLLLLCGQFNYTPRGTLDRTHLRFFTRRTILELLRTASDCKVEGISGSISPAEFVIPSIYHQTRLFKWFGEVRMTGVRLWPGLCAFQTLAIVRKND